MLIFVLALDVFRSSGSNTAVSLLYLSFGLPAFLFGAPAGVLVDRIGAKRSILIANVGRLPILFLFYLVPGNLTAIYPLTFLYSVLTQLFLPAGSVLLPNIIKEKLLLPANSFFSFTFYLSLILGFTAAGPFLKLFGQSSYFVFTILFFLSVLLSGLLPPRLDLWFRFRSSIRTNIFGVLARDLTNYLHPKTIYRQITGVYHDVLLGVIEIRRRRELTKAITNLLMAQISLGVLLSLAPGFSAKVMRIQLEDSSLVMILPAALGMIFGAYVIAHFGNYFRKINLPRYGILAIAAPMILLLPLTLFTQKVGIVSVLLFVLGVGNALVDVPSHTALQSATENKTRGKIYGILGTLIMAAATLPVIISGIFADYFGVGQVIFTVGVLLLILLLFINDRTGSVDNNNATADI